MRAAFILFLALILTIALTLFPDIANQTLRIEAFGWLFETRQGAFVVALLLILAAIWFMRRLVAALFAGPGQLWRTIRVGGRKRREARLREALAQWLDMRGDMGVKTIRKARGILPDWALKMLCTLTVPAHDQTVSSKDKEPLNVVLAARIATDPNAHPKPDLAMRKAHLEAWLHVHPGSPLALIRMADIAEEEQDWEMLVRLLEDIWKRGDCSAASIKPRLARAYLALAKQQPEDALQYLRKAYRLTPEQADIHLALGQSHIAHGDTQAARKLWTGYLEEHSNEHIAQALLELLKNDAMRAYRKLDARGANALNPAQQWLRAELAHTAELEGLAIEHMQALLDQHPSRLAWKSFGDWHAAAGDFRQAAHCYQQALQTGDGSALDNSTSID
ncbi:MAG: tetratricopeptide repeat protein [Mariprofundaceae bacterium]